MGQRVLLPGAVAVAEEEAVVEDFLLPNLLSLPSMKLADPMAYRYLRLHRWWLGFGSASSRLQCSYSSQHSLPFRLCKPELHSRQRHKFLRFRRLHFHYLLHFRSHHHSRYLRHFHFHHHFQYRRLQVSRALA